MNNILALAVVVLKELYRRKDFYVLFILTGLITLTLGAVNFFNDDKIVRYLKEVCLLLIWVSSLVIAIVTTARQIPSERENRTMFPLLAKPVSRAQVLLGKFAGCWFTCGLALLIFYFFFAVVSGTREHQWPILNYFQALWLHWWLLAVVIALTLLGSLVFTSSSANSTIVFVVVTGILFVGRHLGKVALQLPEPSQTIVYAVYIGIPHLEFFDVRDLIVHNGELIAWWAWGVASLYASAYASVFLFLAWLAFRKKALN